MRVPVPAALLLGAYGLVFAAAAFAPYDPGEQHRDFALAPPTRIRLVDAEGDIHRPFVYAIREGNEAGYVEDRGRRYALHFFSAKHLIAVDRPAHIFLFGTDAFGRDLASRIAVGGRLSLTAGAAAAAMALALGFVLGGAAGYAGGALDWSIAHAADVFLAIPWFALVLAVRAGLPLAIPAVHALALVALVVGTAGWAAPARLVRAVVLSGRTEDYVLAARAAGGSPWYILRRHLLSQAVPVVLTQASVLVPRFALAEMTLSFFGLGVAEPTPSWGTLLGDAVRQAPLSFEWWIATPLIVVVSMFVLHGAAADALQAPAVAVVR